MNFGTWKPKGNQFLYGFLRSSSSSSSSSSSFPTAMIEARCFLPDLNRDDVSSVFRAGPQPRDGMSEDMPERMSEDMSDRMSEDMSDRMSEDVRKNARKHVRENVRQNVGQNVRNDVRRFPAVSTSVREAWQHHPTGCLNPSCPKVLAFYCRRCKLEELENCQWAGSCNGNRRMRASLRMLRQLWNLSNRKLAKTKVSSTAVRVGNGLHLCSKLYKAAESFGCGHKRT